MKYLYEYEGQMLAIGKIHKAVSCISEDTLRRLLNRGLKTRSQILGFSPNAAMASGGRKAYGIAKSKGQTQVIVNKGKKNVRPQFSSRGFVSAFATDR